MATNEQDEAIGDDDQYDYEEQLRQQQDDQYDYEEQLRQQQEEEEEDAADDEEERPDEPDIFSDPERGDVTP